jgi:hypothetical protein
MREVIFWLASNLTLFVRQFVYRPMLGETVKGKEKECTSGIV